MARATLLISQQSLYPHAGRAWVRMARHAVRWCRDNGHTVVTSIGVPSRNLVTAMCAIENTSCILVLPSLKQSDVESVLAEYGLTPKDSSIIFSECSAAELSKETRLHQIDDDILRHSDMVIPVSIRPKGYMRDCLEMARREGKEIVTAYETDYKKYSGKVGYSIEPDSVREDLRSFSDPFLIHWTRTSIGPWPDEKAVDYYRNAVESQFYPRSAFDTLRRILSTQCILASSRHIAHATAVVAFSSLPPYNALSLMKWRPRYRQMSFEPYGIGIRYSCGLEMGIRQVTYLNSSAMKRVQDGERWLTQSSGKKTDWSRECEYRYRGKFDLQKVSTEDICIFTRTEIEAKAIKAQFGLRSQWFEK